jgi:hypothetical protein
MSLMPGILASSAAVALALDLSPELKFKILQPEADLADKKEGTYIVSIPGPCQIVPPFSSNHGSPRRGR